MKKFAVIVDPNKMPSGATDTDAAAYRPKINVFAVLGSGHLEYEALLLAESFYRTQNPQRFNLFLAQPAKNALWPDPPRSPLTDIFTAMGATVFDFECAQFGMSYPHGNKIEALRYLPAQEPFIFFDTDTVFLAPLPDPQAMPTTASLRRTDSWPNLARSNHSRHAIWQEVYECANINFEHAQNKKAPLNDFERYPYFNAGMVSGPCPRQFASRWCDTARAIEHSQAPALSNQPKRPWLDQIALGPTIAEFGGITAQGLEFVDRIDNNASHHYRRLPLAFAQAPQAAVDQLLRCADDPRIRPHLERHEAARMFLLSDTGKNLRQTFHAPHAPQDEKQLRKALKSRGLWLR